MCVCIHNGRVVKPPMSLRACALSTPPPSCSLCGWIFMWSICVMIVTGLVLSV